MTLVSGSAAWKVGMEKDLAARGTEAMDDDPQPTVAWPSSDSTAMS
jgi:hypothetical protein